MSSVSLGVQSLAFSYLNDTTFVKHLIQLLQEWAAVFVKVKVLDQAN